MDAEQMLCSELKKFDRFFWIIILSMSSNSRQKIITNEYCEEDLFVHSRRKRKESHNASLRMDEVFKESPTFIQRMSRSKTLMPEQFQSKIKDTTPPHEQLNKLFFMRKVSQEKIFFDDGSQSYHQRSRSKEQINEDIDHSIEFIESVKKNRRLLSNGKKITNLPTIDRKKDMGEVLGLELEIKTAQERSHRRKFITEPNLSGRRNQKSRLKIKTEENAQIGLYSYLERDKITGKVELSKTKIFNYMEYPNNRNFHRMILQKSRRFIQEKVRKNAKDLHKVYDYLEDESKEMIQKETKQKVSSFKKEYQIRRNIPYFSFLTMNPREKQAVLKSLHKNQLGQP